MKKYEHAVVTGALKEVPVLTMTRSESVAAEENARFCFDFTFFH